MIIKSSCFRKMLYLICNSPTVANEQFSLSMTFQLCMSLLIPCITISNLSGQVSLHKLLSSHHTVPPEVLDFNLTELSGTNDRCLGTLILKEVGSTVELPVYVKANPCPDTFQWLHNNSRLSNGTEYSFSNPCDDSSASSPFLYTLTINNLTSETSGNYSANFSNSAGNDSSPTVYIAVPGTCIKMIVAIIQFWITCIHRKITTACSMHTLVSIL